MEKIPFVFYSYKFYNPENESQVPHSDHYHHLAAVHKKPFAYRGEAQETKLVILKDRNIDNQQVLSFFITRQILSHKVSRYDESREIFEEADEQTSHFPRAQIIMIPHLSKMAVTDKGGEKNINAASTMLRFKEILSKLGYLDMKYEYAGTELEVERALNAWEISEFSFNAIPFNPHDHVPGDILSNLLKDNDGKIRGVIKGKGDAPISHMDQGFINEVVGLAKKGYAQFGAKGNTDEGFQASIAKKKHQEEETAPRKLRVYVPERADSEDLVSDVTRIMRQLYE